MGRQAAGVGGIRLAANDRIIACEVVDPELDVVVVSANGMGKRTPAADYPRQGRNGKGVTAMKLTKKTGLIVAAGMAGDDHQLMLMSTNGKAIRMAVSGLRPIGRATQG